MNHFKIATRQSPLALWQAEYVKQRLTTQHPDLTIELVKMVSTGDKLLDSPLAKIGGKGLFTKELEQGLLAHEADIAVHSMKDVPAQLADAFELGAVLVGEDPHDAFVSNQYDSFESLPQNAIVGTSSLRRQSQLLAQRPDLKIDFLRGNVNTRLQKLDDGLFDAIILAASGLKRLNMAHRISQLLALEICLPAVGQGVLGIECRQGDAKTKAIIAPLHHLPTAQTISAERAMNKRLQGGCQVPIAGHAILQQDKIWLRGLVAEIEGGLVIRAEATEVIGHAVQLGIDVAESLLAQGADKILANYL